MILASRRKRTIFAVCFPPSFVAKTLQYTEYSRAFPPRPAKNVLANLRAFSTGG